MDHAINLLQTYGLTWLISALIVAVAVAVALLSGASRTVKGHVYRLGKQAARIRLQHARGPVAVSLRQIDENHVWVRVEGPADTTFTDAPQTHHQENRTTAGKQTATTAGV